MTLRRLIWRGERFPRGYGMAWLDYQRNAAVCYPIPLNVVMRAVYLAWVWCCCPWGVTEREISKATIAELRARLDRPGGEEWK